MKIFCSQIKKNAKFKSRESKSVYIYCKDLKMPNSNGIGLVSKIIMLGQKTTSGGGRLTPPPPKPVEGLYDSILPVEWLFPTFEQKHHHYQ